MSTSPSRSFLVLFIFFCSVQAYVLVFGETGVGKSTICGVLTGRPDLFPAGSTAYSTTSRWAAAAFSGRPEDVCIDTVGIGNNQYGSTNATNTTTGDTEALLDIFRALKAQAYIRAVVFVTGCNNRLDDNTRRALERTLDLLVAAGVANVPVILLHSKVDRERALCEPCQQVAHGADSQVAQTLRAAGFSVTTELCEDAHRDPLALRQTLGAALDPLPAARPVLLPPNFEELIYKSDPAEAVRQFQEFRCGEAHAALVASHMAERELMNCRNQLQICPLVLSSCKTTRTWKCGRRRFGFAGPRRTCFEESTDPICVQKEIEKQKNCVSEQNDRIKDACSAASEALEATRARFSAICSDKCDFGPSHFLSQTPLAHGETLMEETALVSSNGLYRMVMQNDGNLVVYASTIPLWASNTQGQGQKPYRLLMQSDNNLVMFDAHNRHIWSTKTSNHGAAGGRLIVQDDGNCVIYDSAGKPLWCTHTHNGIAPDNFWGAGDLQFT